MKYLLAFLMGIMIYPALADLSQLVDDTIDTNTWVTVGVPSYGLTLGVTGRCTNLVRSNGITNRVYFGCGKVNNLISDTIYGE